MNRRDFLKSLAAFGALTSISPEALLAATDAQVDIAWQTQELTPLIFYVNSWGALSSEPDNEAADTDDDQGATRGGVLDIDYPPSNLADVGTYLQSNARLSEFAERYITDAADITQKNSARPLRSWLESAGSVRLTQLTDSICDWLDEEVDASEVGHSAMAGFSGQASAMQFFQHEPDISEMLEIRIIGGDHPGSSYFAAETTQDIDATNALAAAAGIPIRFAAGND